MPHSSCLEHRSRNNKKMCKSPKTAKRHVLISHTRICRTLVYVICGSHMAPGTTNANVSTSFQYDDKLLNVAAPVSRPVAINEPNPDQLIPPLSLFLRISRSVDNLLLTYLSDTMHTLLRLLIVCVYVYGGFAWRLPLQTLLSESRV